MSATAALLWLALLLATCIAQNTRVATSNTRDRIAPTSNQATDLAGVANTALSAGGRHELYEGQEGGVQLQPQIGGNKFTRRGDAQTAIRGIVFRQFSHLSLFTPAQRITKLSISFRPEVDNVRYSDTARLPFNNAPVRLFTVTPPNFHRIDSIRLIAPRANLYVDEWSGPSCLFPANNNATRSATYSIGSRVPSIECDFDTSRLAMLHSGNFTGDIIADCDFAVIIDMFALNSVFRTREILLTVTYDGPPHPQTFSDDDAYVPPSAPAAAYYRRAAELRPETVHIGAPNPAGFWFERAATTAEAPLLGFLKKQVAGVGAPPSVEFRQFVPVNPLDSWLWPPPADATLEGITFSFVGGTGLVTRGDPSVIALMLNSGGSRRAYHLSRSYTCGVLGISSDTMRNIFGSNFTVPFANSLPSNASQIGADSCNMGLRIGMAMDQYWPLASAAFYEEQMIKQVRFTVFYRTLAPPPATTPASADSDVFSLTQPAGTASGGPAGWLEQYNSMFALQSGLSFARLAVALPAPAFPIGKVQTLVLGKFSLAALPADATIERLVFSIDHASIRSIVIQTGQSGSASFAWSAVRLRGANGTLLATASDATGCLGNDRVWVSENCRASGNCMAAATFARWSPSAPKRDQLASCEFAVELDFVRTDDDGSSPRSNDSGEYGLRANGLALALLPNSTVPLAAVLGPATVNVQYKSASQRATARISATVAVSPAGALPPAPTPAPTPAPAGQVRLLTTGWMDAVLSGEQNVRVDDAARQRALYLESAVKDVKLAPVSSTHGNAAVTAVPPRPQFQSSADQAPVVLRCIQFVDTCLWGVGGVDVRAKDDSLLYIGPREVSDSRAADCVLRQGKVCAILLTSNSATACNQPSSIFTCVDFSERVRNEPDGDTYGEYWSRSGAFIRTTVAPPTTAPAPTSTNVPTSAPAPQVVYKVSAQFPDLLDQVPFVGDVVGIEVQLVQRWECRAPSFQTRVAPPYAKSAVTMRAEHCGSVVDTSYDWQFAGGRVASDGSCFAATRAWPADDSQTPRTIGGPTHAWLAGLKTGDLLNVNGNGTRLLITSRLTRAATSLGGVPSGALTGVRMRVHFQSSALAPDAPDGCTLRTRRDGRARVLVPSLAVPASGLMSMWVRGSELAKFSIASALLMSFEPTISAIGSLRLLVNTTALELLEFRETDMIGATAMPSNATMMDVDNSTVVAAREDFVRVAIVALSADTRQQVSGGAYVFVAVQWNQTHVCLFAGRGTSESSACSAVALAAVAAQSSGVLAVGGLAGAEREAEFTTVPVDIDTFVLTRDLASASRRRRGWYDRDDPQLAVAVTFESGGATTECPCGNATLANLARKSASAMLQFMDVDCNTADCARAQLLSSPSASVEGSVSRLHGSAAVAELATHVVRLCNASFAAAQSAKLSHAYRVRGNGTLVTASTCRFAASDTRIYVFRADLCPLIADTNDRSKCVASNDNSLRGPRLCPNGGSEVTWTADADVEYLIVVVAPDEKSVPGAASTTTFALDVQACARPRCPSLPSCFACSHLTEPTSPFYISIRDKTVTRALSFESRCVGQECDGSFSTKLRLPVQASVSRPLQPPSGSAALVFRRGNARITITPVSVAPAVFVEPDFNSSTGNDNGIFTARFGSSAGGFSVKSDSILQFYCANPLPLRYRFVLLDGALASQLIVTNTTCTVKEKARMRNSTLPMTINVQNDKCGDDYQVERIRCAAHPLPTLGADVDVFGRAVSVCRPDLELAGLRAAVEADPALVETRRQLVKDTLKDGEASVDCNVPPIPSTVLNCSAAVLENTTASGLKDQLLTVLHSSLTGDDAARQQATANLRATRDAALCEVKQREREARDKAALFLAPGDCWDCRTGPGVAVELVPEFGDEFLCYAQQRSSTALMARLTIELDDVVVLDNVTVPLTASGIGAGVDAFRALFAVADPPVDVVLKRDVSSSNSDVTVDLAEAPPDWVPFADGHSGEWTNETCLRVPKALETFPARSWRRARASAWVRMRESDQRAYIAAQKALQASVSGDAARAAASSLAAKVGAGVPQSVAAVWEHFGEGTATQRTAELAFSMSGSLLGGLAPRGKVDESSVTAQIHVDMTSDPQFDIVTIGLQGHLFNVFNGTESYTFEVHCRDVTGQTVASWDVLQRYNTSFRLEVELRFAASDEARNATDTFSRYTTSYTVEIRDSTSLFAVLPSVNQTQLSLYEAEQAKRQQELDERLLPLIYFFGAAPVAAILLVIVGWVMQRCRPITDDDLYPRHVWVIAAYVGVRVVRSILLTTTVMRVIMLAVLDEPLVTLEQLPVWVDSMSNKSAEITALANDALNREIERQGSTFAVEQSKCLELLDQITGDARARRLQIELQHAIEKDLRNVAQLQEEISSRRSAELKSMSDAMVQMQAQQTLCWKKWSAQVFNTSFNFEASFKAKISANYRELNANFDSVNAKLDGFKTQYDSFVVRSKAMAIKAKGLYDGFKSFIGYVDDVDFLNLASLPRPSAPPLFEAGPDWNFVPLSTKPLGDWLVDLKMPECPCDGAPPPPPPFMENNTQAARNYTAFAPAKEKQEKKSASAVPIPSVSLRSFVSLPVLIDLFGWLPDFGWLAGLLVIVDILLIVFTHIRTIQGVAALVRGHIEEDEIVRDYNVGARVVRACGCGWGAALIACVLRCVDVCEVAMRKHRRILVTAVSVTFNALLGMTAVALFALGMYILAEVASAVLTIQALDGLGIISAIVAPVTSALGTANVKAIENARVINTQTLLAAENAYNQALFELAQTTNDFNDDQERDLAAFNDEYCQLYATLATYDKRPTECVNPVRQIPAVVVLEECPYWLEVVPRLYADVDRTQYRDLVVTTLEPFVVAARTIVLDCIWFVAYVVIGVAVMFILSTALYYLLVLVHMIRVRKRVIFDSDRALKSKYTTRKDADGVPLKDKENSTRLRFGRPRRRAETEMETARFEGEEESDSALPGNRIKSGDHTEAVMQKLPSKFGPLPDSDFDALSKPGARHTVHIVPSAPAPTESILPPPPGSFGRSRSRSRRSSSRRSRRSARRATMPPSSAAALNNDIYASVSSAGVQPPYVSAARAPPASAASPAPPPNVQQLPKFGATSALPPPIAHDDDDDDDEDEPPPPMRAAPNVYGAPPRVPNGGNLPPPPPPPNM